MSSSSQHHRRVLDQLVHRAHGGWAEPEARAAFVALLAVVRARSDLFAAPTAVRDRRPCFDQLDALVAIARWWREHRVAIDAWPGRRGHPLVVIDDLQRHVLGLFPTPRFLARAWCSVADAGADGDTWREWLIAHGRGVSLRRLPLPIELTRAMAHHLLVSPDHLALGAALRRAEILGLGGSDALAMRVAECRLGQSFEHGAYWRVALGWIVRNADELAPGQLVPVLDYLAAARAWTSVPPVAGRSATSLSRDVRAWHVTLGRTSSDRLRWAPLGLATHDEHQDLDDGTRVSWHLVELLDSGALLDEGRALRHCVAAYSYHCRGGRSSIWSLRRRTMRRGELGAARSLATIEIDPRRRVIVQARGPANSAPRGPGVAVLRRWAAGQHLTWAPEVLASLAA